MEMNLLPKPSLAELSQICQECCFSTDNGVKRKAELFLNQYFINISGEEISYILLGSPEVVLFVMCQYMFNNIRLYKDQRSLAVLFVNGLVSWRSDANVFVRKGERLKGFALNTYVRLVGELLKRVFVESDGRAWLYEFIASYAPEVQLLLWRFTIESVDEIDSGMGFLAYRNMIYAFQDDAMCRIMEAAIPFFHQLAEVVRFNELIVMQSNLTVDESPSAGPKRALFFSAQELATAELVLELLRLITCYKYNITYSEYDLESHFENCAICYPDKIKEYLVREELYEALFYIAERFILEKPDDPLLKKCMSCLQKIVLCRMVYEKKDLRRDFVRRSIRGITRLMELTDRRALCREFVEFNRKMISNTPLKKFRNEPCFSKWVSLNQQYFLGLIRLGDLVFENDEMLEAFDLLIKIVDEFANVKLSEFRPGVRAMCREIFEQIIQRLLSGNHSLAGDVSLRSTPSAT